MQVISSHDSAPQALQEASATLQRHRLYGQLTTPQALQIFCEHHVVCVLDFMSLLKSLQREVAGIRVPWIPAEDPTLVRFIQSIVVDEEADVWSDGRTLSHFSYYLEAMREVGADPTPIEGVIELLRSGESFSQALKQSSLPKPAKVFGLSTAAFLEQPSHILASVFFYGREDIIPELFLPMIAQLSDAGLPCTRLQEYLQRHADLDGDEHGPLAKQLLAGLCNQSPKLEQEAQAAALQSLEARVALWDAISIAIDESTPG